MINNQSTLRSENEYTFNLEALTQEVIPSNLILECEENTINLIREPIFILKIRRITQGHGKLGGLHEVQGEAITFLIVY